MPSIGPVDFRRSTTVRASGTSSWIASAIAGSATETIISVARGARASTTRLAIVLPATSSRAFGRPKRREEPPARTRAVSMMRRNASGLEKARSDPTEGRADKLQSLPPLVPTVGWATAPMTDSERNFVRGRGSYVGDLVLPRMLHLKIVRSIYARARLVAVKAPISGRDISANMSSVGEGAEGGTGQVPFPALARDRVNYVGQPIAAVLGESEARAEDLLDSVDIEYEPLKPIVDPEEALHAEPIHPGTTTNVFVDARAGKAFRNPPSPVVLEDLLTNERVVPNPLEPRGVVVDWDGHRLTVYASTQSVTSFREGFQEAFKLPANAVRVMQMDTGGAFGSKGGMYPEYVVAAHVAMRERRPVRWIETRSEHLQATEHGRGARARMTIFADRSGRVQALRGDLLVDGGAYSAGMGSFAPAWIGYQLTGPYAIPKG